MSEEDQDKKKDGLESNFGFVGGEIDLDTQSQSLENLTSPVMGAGLDVEDKDGDYNAEFFAGIDFSGESKIGMRGEYNLFDKEADEDNGFSYDIDAVGNVMYATRAGGFVSAIGLQAEAVMLEGHLKTQASAGYVKSADSDQSGFYSQIRADVDFSKDECTGFMQKGCLTNLAQATFPPEGGYQFRNEFLHDIVYQGQKLNIRAGPSLEINSENNEVVPGVALRVDFDL
jgi:hypothetical protein